MPRPDEVTAIAAIFWHLRRFGSVVMEPHNSFTLTTNLLKSCPPCVNINWGTGSKDQLTYCRDILAKEAALAEESRLILQIIETRRTLVSTAEVKVLNTVADVFTKRIADE